MNYLQQARKIYKDAKEEFEIAKHNHDEVKIRKSAEAAWGATVQAANALLEKYNVKIPNGTRKREDLLIELQEKHRKLQELRLAERYTYFLHHFHIDCFYDGEVSVKRIERDFRKLQEYIDTIAGV